MKKTEHYGFDGQYKIHQCCSKRKDKIALRPFVGYCIFMDGYVYATDAHMMVRASLTKISNLSQEDIDKLQNKAIRGDLFRKMLSYDIKAITDTAIECIREQDETVPWERRKSGYSSTREKTKESYRSKNLLMTLTQFRDY